MEGNELTAEERRALDALLPPDRQTGDVDMDLIAAARESRRRREQNTLDGGAVIDALYRRGRTWRGVEAETGIPFNTARDWRRKVLDAAANAVDTEAEQAPAE